MRPPLRLDEELDVIGPLKSLSNKFKLFYENERGKAGQIKWYYDRSLSIKIPSAEAAHVDDPSRNLHTICLTKFPVSVKDAHLIAHEIMHAVIAEEGNNLKIVEQSILYSQFKAYISSMLEDPIVESVLYKKYKFNVLNDYLRWIEIMQSACKEWKEPRDILLQMSNACHLANQMMRWDLIEEQDALITWSEFLKDYNITHPNIYSFAFGFFKIMHKNGLDTLDQRRSAFSEISENYNLNRYLILENNLASKV